MKSNTQTLRANLQAIGYEEMETGGGCQALAMTVQNARPEIIDGKPAVETLVMITDEAQLPTWGEDVIVGLYPLDAAGDYLTDGETFEIGFGARGYSHFISPVPQLIADIVAVLDATAATALPAGGRKAELLRRLNAQRTGIEVHVASLDTRRFNFTAYGSSLTEARTALELALVRHAEQYDLSEDWADDFAEDVVEQVVVLGEGYRHHECVTGNLKVEDADEDDIVPTAGELEGPRFKVGQAVRWFSDAATVRSIDHFAASSQVWVYSLDFDGQGTGVQAREDEITARD